jgi:hypothetical protein
MERLFAMDNILYQDGKRGRGKQKGTGVKRLAGEPGYWRGWEGLGNGVWGEYELILDPIDLSLLRCGLDWI